MANDSSAKGSASPADVVGSGAVASKRDNRWCWPQIVSSTSAGEPTLGPSSHHASDKAGSYCRWRTKDRPPSDTGSRCTVSNFGGSGRFSRCLPPRSSRLKKGCMPADIPLLSVENCLGKYPKARPQLLHLLANKTGPRALSSLDVCETASIL